MRLDWPGIAAQLAREGIQLDAGVPAVAVSGGDISAAYRVASQSGFLFVKCGPSRSRDMFAAEAAGLAEIAATGTVRVPEALFAGQIGDVALLVLEWLDIEPPDESAARRFGAQLAALHRVTADRFGWHRDNTIGATPQPNTPSDDWIGFYREQRLSHQLRLAAANGFNGELQEQGAQLCASIDGLFDSYCPQPSLLHGDLWGGNWAACNGAPVMFDPAVYYGDRETDLAMTRLFGGFPGAFYAAYQDAWPLADGHEARIALYQLYHVLNHLNLFGGGYLSQAVSLMRRLEGAGRKGSRAP